MITNFKEKTGKLTQHELVMVPHLVNILKEAKSKQMAITGKKLCVLLNENYNVYYINQMRLTNFSIDGVRLRKMIHHIRCEGLVLNLCSTQKGYFIGDKKDCEEYIISLNERVGSIKQIIEAIKKNL